MTEEERAAAKKRRADALENTITGVASGPSPQQGANANAGTQKASGSAASAASGSKASGAVSAAAPAAAAGTLNAEPVFLLDDDQFTQVLVMKVDALKALASAMGIDVEGDARAMMIKKVVRFMGTCDSVKSFDPSTESFEFEEMKKQDFQQPTAQPPQA